MKYPLSDICDRFTILQLKTERLPEDNTIVELFAIFTEELGQRISGLGENTRKKVLALVKQLYDANAATWDLEADLRAGKMDEATQLEEIGRRAIAIRESNKKRLSIKNRIAVVASQIYGFDFGFDKKGDHLSE